MTARTDFPRAVPNHERPYAVQDRGGLYFAGRDYWVSELGKARRWVHLGEAEAVALRYGGEVVQVAEPERPRRPQGPQSDPLAPDPWLARLSDKSTLQVAVGMFDRVVRAGHLDPAEVLREVRAEIERRSVHPWESPAKRAQLAEIRDLVDGDPSETRAFAERRIAWDRMPAGEKCRIRRARAEHYSAEARRNRGEQP